MPVKRQILYNYGTYFIGFTCCDSLLLINRTDSYDLVYKWFDFLKGYGHYIIGYVIMPDQVQALVAFQNSGQSINTLVGNGKRFIAYGIIRRLKAANYTDILWQLRSGVNAADTKKGKLHEVWENSFDWKECITREMIIHQLDSMHNNPCSGKWRLVENPVDYLHSSAKYYITPGQATYDLTDFIELEQINLATENIVMNQSKIFSI